MRRVIPFSPATAKACSDDWPYQADIPTIKTTFFVDNSRVIEYDVNDNVVIRNE